MRGLPVNGMKAVDGAKIVDTYVKKRPKAVPLATPVRTLRARVLETSGLHHNFWGDEDFAQRVQAANKKKMIVDALSVATKKAAKKKQSTNGVA